LQAIISRLNKLNLSKKLLINAVVIFILKCYN
jgi:hypothetical protein